MSDNGTFKGSNMLSFVEDLPPWEVFPDEEWTAFLIENKKGDNESEEPPYIPSTLNAFSADRLLVRMSVIQSRIEEVENLYRQEVDHLDNWKESMLNNLQRQYNFLSDCLKNWLKSSGLKSQKLPHGTLSFRKQPPHVEIINEEALFREEQFLRLKRYPDKSAILKAYKTHGLIPQGCEIIQPEDKFSVKLRPVDKTR